MNSQCSKCIVKKCHFKQLVVCLLHTFIPGVFSSLLLLNEPPFTEIQLLAASMRLTNSVGICSEASLWGLSGVNVPPFLTPPDLLVKQ